MRVSDFLAQELRKTIDTVFMVTGGGAMHLNDAFGSCFKGKVVHNHHEQACAIAAESYARLSGKPALVNCTTGPGGINALNGVFGAYVDSIPMVVVSGQVKRETMARYAGVPLRQLGDQEVDIFEMVKPVVKYAAVLDDATRAAAVLEKALHLATNGRPGPVWIDVPIDVQGASIDLAAQAHWNGQLAEPATKHEWVSPNTVQDAALEADCAGAIGQIVQQLRIAKRPVVFAGAGVRISGMHRQFMQLLDRLGIAAVSGWNAHDAIPVDHRCYAGRPSVVGDRAGNFAVQNADFLLVLGSRLNVRQVSYAWKNFASRAWIAHVDVDKAELDKATLHSSLKVHADLRQFLPRLLESLEGHQPAAAHGEYLAWCRERTERYPVVQPDYWNSPLVNPYCFIDKLWDALDEEEVVVSADGTACVAAMQASKIRPGQRLYTNSGCASMGYDLPAAIGACIAAGRKRIICLAGDGSVMMNLQELQTIIGYRLPIKLFVLNNQGYHSIRQTQNAYFPGNEVGVGPESGVSFPDFIKIAAAFGVPGRRAATHAEMEQAISATLNGEGAQMCELLLDVHQDFAPKLASRRLPDGTMVSPSLEDMAPFLSREELQSNMIGD
jgi:acetolactate synthase-1/2/3 large subunit